MMKTMKFSTCISINRRRLIGRICLLFWMDLKRTKNLISLAASKEWLKHLPIMLHTTPLTWQWETHNFRKLKLITQPWLSSSIKNKSHPCLINKLRCLSGEVLFVLKKLLRTTILLILLGFSHSSPVLLATKLKLTVSQLSMEMLNTELFSKFI